MSKLALPIVGAVLFALAPLVQADGVPQIAIVTKPAAVAPLRARRVTTAPTASAGTSIVATVLCFQSAADARGYSCPAELAEFTWYLGTCSSSSCSWQILDVPPSSSSVVVPGLLPGFLYRLQVTVPWSVNSAQALYRP